MMDEMAKTLARRRAAAEKKQPEQPSVHKHLSCNSNIPKLTKLNIGVKRLARKGKRKKAGGEGKEKIALIEQFLL